jgi:RecA-family ATPase
VDLEHEPRKEVSAQVFRAIDLSDLEHAPYEPTDYVLDPYLPRGLVALFAGHGGSGKTNLALIWAAHVAAGWNWRGFSVTPGRVLIVSLEDPGERVRSVMRKIVEAYGLPWQPISEFITILDGTATDAALAIEVRNQDLGQVLVETAAFAELAVRAIDFDLVVIDNASDAYNGNENERRSVRKFMREMLGRIAREQNCAVLLLAHIDKAAARSGGKGNSYSGSTAWHNSARSRMALVDSDSGPELQHEKLNVGKRADPVSLEWSQQGVLMPKQQWTISSTREPETLEADAAAVLAAISAAHAAGANVSTGVTGSTTTLHVLLTRPELPEELRNKSGKHRFWMALTSLQTAGKIKRETYRNEHRKDAVRWVPAPMRECAPMCVNA